MRTLFGFAFVATTVLLARGAWGAQELARPVLPAPQSLSPDGAPTPNPECSIRAVIAQMIGEGARECGVRRGDEVRLELDLQALACVVDGVESGEDFLFLDAPPGVDSSLVVAIFSRAGRLFVLNWDSNASGGPGYRERLLLYEPETWDVSESNGERDDSFAGRLVPRGRRYPLFLGGETLWICRHGVRTPAELPSLE
ncbi:MAG: hypothetical protein AAGK22_13840 [Acidobacteriota bacterium]